MSMAAYIYPKTIFLVIGGSSMDMYCIHGSGQVAVQHALSGGIKSCINSVLMSYCFKFCCRSSTSPSYSITMESTNSVEKFNEALEDGGEVCDTRYPKCGTFFSRYYQSRYCSSIDCDPSTCSTVEICIENICQKISYGWDATCGWWTGSCNLALPVKTNLHYIVYQLRIFVDINFLYRRYRFCL